MYFNCRENEIQLNKIRQFACSHPYSKWKNEDLNSNLTSILWHYHHHKNQHLSSYYVPGTVLSALHYSVSLYNNFIKCYNYSCFIEEETETLRSSDQVIHLIRWQSQDHNPAPEPLLVKPYKLDYSTSLHSKSFSLFDQKITSYHQKRTSKGVNFIKLVFFNL